MATSVQTLPIVSESASYSPSHSGFTNQWKNRIAYWKKEAGFLMEIINLHCDVNNLSLNARKAKFQFDILMKEELPGLLRSMEALSLNDPAANNNAKKRLRAKLVRAEQKFNLLKLVLLEIAAERIPLRLG